MNGGIMNYMDQLQILLLRMYSLILPILIYIIYITCTTRRKAGKSKLIPSRSPNHVQKAVSEPAQTPTPQAEPALCPTPPTPPPQAHDTQVQLALLQRIENKDHEGSGYENFGPPGTKRDSREKERTLRQGDNRKPSKESAKTACPVAVSKENAKTADPAIVSQQPDMNVQFNPEGTQNPSTAEDRTGLTVSSGLRSTQSCPE